MKFIKTAGIIIIFSMLIIVTLTILRIRFALIDLFAIKIFISVFSENSIINYIK